MALIALNLNEALEAAHLAGRRQAVDRRARDHAERSGPDWKSGAPRWFLVIALGLTGGGLLWYEIGWRGGVNAHIEKATEGSHQIDTLKGEVGTLRGEISAMRKDQLEFYRWQAERAGVRWPIERPGQTVD